MPTYADLANIVNPQINDGYGVLDKGLMYIWNGTSFPLENEGVDLGLKPSGDSNVETGNVLAVSGDKVARKIIPIEDSIEKIIVIKNLFRQKNQMNNVNVNVNSNNATLIFQEGSISAYVELKNNTNYTITHPNFNTPGFRFGLFDSLELSDAPSISNRITTKTFNSGSHRYLIFGVKYQSNPIINLNLIQVEIGSTATEIETDLKLKNQSQLDSLEKKVNNTLDSNRYIRNVVGKNLFDFENLLIGWRYSSSAGFEQNTSGIMSNKLFLSPGIHTIQSIKPYNADTVRILAFNSKDEMLFADGITMSNRVISVLEEEENEVEHTIYAGNYNVLCSSKFINVAYFRVCLKFDDTISIYSPNTAQFIKGETPILFEKPVVKLSENPNYGKSEKLIFASGASTTVSSNGWFERACRELGFKSINVAVSGESVMQHATKAWRGTLWTFEELDSMNVLSLSHNHNYDIAYIPEVKSVLCNTVADYEAKGYDTSNNPLTVPLDKNNPNHRLLPEGSRGASGTLEPDRLYDERYAAGYDYLIKKYREECYNLKFNPNSKWFNSEYGKPCTIIICSHWHDGYVVFNEAAKIVCERTGAIYCDTASVNGWTYKTTNPSDPNSIRWSAQVCHNASYGGSNDLHDAPINGVIYTNMGFHPTRDVNSEFNKRRASVFKDLLIKILL